MRLELVAGSDWGLVVGLGDWTDCGARAGCMSQSHGSTVQLATINIHYTPYVCIENHADV